MKRAFVLQPNGHLTSALVPVNTKDALSLGDRITASRLLDLGPGAQIKRGERGTVASLDVLTGTVEVLMDTKHAGLTAWDNHMCLEPYGTEDLLDGVVCAGPSLFPRVPKWALVVAASLLIGVASSVLHHALFVEHAFDLLRDGDRASVIFTRSILITLGLISTAITVGAA